MSGLGVMTPDEALLTNGTGCPGFDDPIVNTLDMEDWKDAKRTLLNATQSYVSPAVPYHARNEVYEPIPPSGTLLNR